MTWPPEGIKPYFCDDSVCIILGDCRDVLPKLATGSVDLVLTDPPYGVDYMSSWRTYSDPLVAPIVGDANLNALRDALPDLSRLLQNDRHSYIFASAMRIGESLQAIGEYLAVKNVIVWDKGDSGTVGDLECGYGCTWEGIVYTMKGRRMLNGPRPRAIYRYDWQGQRDPVHPTVKPVALLKWLILKSSNEGELILDPFAGSCTTGRAAKDLGRKAILIEIEEKFCEIGAKRMSQSVMDLNGV